MSRRKLRVVVLMHQDLIPPDDISGMSEEESDPIKTEYDVVTGLGHLGHEVVKLGVHDEIAPLRRALAEVQPHVVFNLLEEFHGQTIYDQHVVSYLELSKTAYTGCNPRGLVIGRDKALSKKILAYHRIKVPKFGVFPRGKKIKKPSKLEFPLIVKSLIEEGSTGISEASVVHTDQKLVERIEFMHHTIQTDAIVEQYIDGRELYAAMLGNHRITVFPPWEMKIGKLRPDAPMIATRKVKWDLDFQERRDVQIGPAELEPELLRKYESVSRRIYRALDLSGYARLDFRLGTDGELYFLEANPNPDIAYNEEYASAALAGGMEYEPLLQKVVNLGIAHMKGLAG